MSDLIFHPKHDHVLASKKTKQKLQQKCCIVIRSVTIIHVPNLKPLWCRWWGREGVPWMKLSDLAGTVLLFMNAAAHLFCGPSPATYMQLFAFDSFTWDCAWYTLEVTEMTVYHLPPTQVAKSPEITHKVIVPQGYRPEDPERDRRQKV